MHCSALDRDLHQRRVRLQKFAPYLECCLACVVNHAAVRVLGDAGNGSSCDALTLTCRHGHSNRLPGRMSSTLLLNGGDADHQPHAEEARNAVRRYLDVEPPSL